MTTVSYHPDRGHVGAAAIDSLGRTTWQNLCLLRLLPRMQKAGAQPVTLRRLHSLSALTSAACAPRRDVIAL